MNIYAFTGAVYYATTGRPKERLTTRITIESPSADVAQAILDNYGMESLRLERAEPSVPSQGDAPRA